MALIEGWKLVRKDGSTSNNFRWPLVVAGVQDPVTVAAHDVDRTHDGECPSRPGDGLCVALTVWGACSGGISLVDAVGLSLTYDEADILGGNGDKRRVARVTVVDVFDPLAKVRAGGWKDLRYANLRDANLRDANLRGADLRYANLGYANLGYANLGNANLGNANLGGANLRGANLRGADLRYADLRYADLGGAGGEPRSGMLPGWRLNTDGRWERDR